MKIFTTFTLLITTYLSSYSQVSIGMTRDQVRNELLKETYSQIKYNPESKEMKEHFTFLDSNHPEVISMAAYFYDGRCNSTACVLPYERLNAMIEVLNKNYVKESNYTWMFIPAILYHTFRILSHPSFRGDWI